MSIIIYSEDFISISWEINEYKTEDLVEEVDNTSFPTKIDETKTIQKQLHLIFTIQVNWKLKNFEWFFILEQFTWWENSNKSSELSLKDWWEWYTILNLFTALGYKIWDYELWQPWSWIINQWINKLI